MWVGLSQWTWYAVLTDHRQTHMSVVDVVVPASRVPRSSWIISGGTCYCASLCRHQPLSREVVIIPACVDLRLCERKML